MFIKRRISYKQFLAVFLCGQSFQCLLCRLEDRFSNALLQYFLSSCTVHNLEKFLLVGGILPERKVNAWTVYFFSRLICIPLLICMFLFCVFFSQEHQKMQPPGTLLLKLFQNSQHVFLSSLNLLALRAGVSFLKHYIGWPSLVYLRSQSIRVQTYRVLNLFCPSKDIRFYKDWL